MLLRGQAVRAASRVARRTAAPHRSRRFSSAVQIRVLIVDGYAKASQDGFTEAGMPLASDLYRDMLARQAPENAELVFDTIFPCVEGYVPPTEQELARYDGCAFTGSSYSVYDPAEDVQVQLELFDRALHGGVSMFGSCWGLQVAAQCLGGTVELNALGREVGVGRKIALTADGADHALFAGKGRVFEAFESHGDHVTAVPEGALVLAGNAHTPVQAMSVTVEGVESWFVQYHPEYNLGYFGTMISTRKERMLGLGFFDREEDVAAYTRDLLALHDDPSNKALAWKYGFDDDMMDSDTREIEPRNWVRYLVQRAVPI